MALALATSPARVFSTGPATTTASFTPAANSLLVAMVDVSDIIGETVSITDSLSSSWTLIRRQNATVYSNAEIWMLDVGASPAARTVTATASSGNGLGLSVAVYTGAGSVAQHVASAAKTNRAATDLTITLTPNASGGDIVAAMANAYYAENWVANAATAVAAPFGVTNDGSTGATYAAMHAATTTAAGVAKTLGFTDTARDTGAVAVEILPSPTVETTTVVAGGDAAGATISVPAGVATNDIILVYIYNESIDDAITPPAGFTEKTPAVRISSGQSDIMHCFWKRATGADSGTYVFSWTNSSWREACALRVSGVVTTGDPFNNYQTASDTSQLTGVTPAPSSFTPSVDGCLIVWSGSNWTGGAWTPPTGYTENIDQSGDLSVATLLQKTAAATGSVTGTCVGNAIRGAIVGAIIPVGTSTGVTNWTQTPTDDAGLVDVTTDAFADSAVDDAGVADSTLMPLTGDSLAWTITVT